MRNNRAGRGYERVWCGERRQAYISDVVISKIGSIGQIKNLEKQRQCCTLFDLEVLGVDRVQLFGRLSNGANLHWPDRKQFLYLTALAETLGSPNEVSVPVRSLGLLLKTRTCEVPRPLPDPRMSTDPP